MILDMITLALLTSRPGTKCTGMLPEAVASANAPSGQGFWTKLYMYIYMYVYQNR